MRVVFPAPKNPLRSVTGSSGLWPLWDASFTYNNDVIIRHWKMKLEFLATMICMELLQVKIKTNHSCT